LSMSSLAIWARAAALGCACLCEKSEKSTRLCAAPPGTLALPKKSSMLGSAAPAPTVNPTSNTTCVEGCGACVPVIAKPSRLYHPRCRTPLRAPPRQKACMYLRGNMCQCVENQIRH
jgi:hypothetical protein